MKTDKISNHGNINKDYSFDLINEIHVLARKYEKQFTDKGVKCSVRLEYKKVNGVESWFSRVPKESHDPKKRHHYKYAVIRFLPTETKVCTPENIREYSFALYYRRNNFVINHKKEYILRRVENLFRKILSKLSEKSVSDVCYNSHVDYIRYLHGNYKYKEYLGRKKRDDYMMTIAVYLLLALVVLALYIPICIIYFGN